MSNPTAEKLLTARDKRILACVPTTWLDDALTGSQAIKLPALCPEIERLCNIIRARLIVAMQRPRRRKSK